MSDTPTTDAWDEDAQRFVKDICVEDIRTMERHLRKLRAMANCYVPPSVLDEVDKFLSHD